MTQNRYFSEKDYEKTKDSNNLLSNTTVYSETTNLNPEFNNLSQNINFQNNYVPSTFEKDSNSYNLYNPSKGFF